MSLPLSEKLILRQINHWNRLREYLQECAPTSAPRRGPVLTVSRQTGSGGRLLAQILAEKLELELHDQSLVDRIARDKNLEKSFVAQLDERVVSQAALWVQGVLKRRIFLKDEYHLALVKVITRLAARGGVVFLGRGAGLILREEADLRIRVVGSLRQRLANLQERTGLSRAEARALLVETDRRREEFTRRTFQIEPGQPECYDLVLNCDRLSPAQMAETALVALLQASRARADALAASRTTG